MTNQLSKIALLLALWPVWLWNFERLTDKSDEPLSLLALITLGFLLWERRSKHSSPVIGPSNIALAILAAYCTSILCAPKLVQGTLAVATMCLVLPGTAPLTFPCWMLAMLSLPVVATLNFYLGYPLRVMVGSIAVPMLNMIGYSTSLEGTALMWNSQIVEIDAPCSGIKMLWFSTYLSATLSAFFNLGNRDALRVFAVAVISAIAANVLRVTSLFFLETGAIAIPATWHDFLHQAVGVIVFLLGASLTLACAFFLRAEPANIQRKTSICAERIQSTQEVTDENAKVTESSAKVAEGSAKVTDNSANVKAGNNNTTRWRSVSLLALSGVAAILPLIATTHNAVSSSVTNSDFPGWPDTFEGRALRPVAQSPEQSETQQRFANEFPGKIKVFTNGKETVLLRWVAQPTRQLHSSSDCYRGLGFTVKWLPMLVDADGARWSTFEANNSKEHLLIRERITDASGVSWSDVSAWYWAAVMQRTKAPWWATTVIVRE